jgi:hypothetical protein
MLLMTIALFVWTYQHNQQPSSSVFLSQQTSEQYFQHNKPAKRTGCMLFMFKCTLGRYNGWSFIINRIEFDNFDAISIYACL